MNVGASAQLGVIPVKDIRSDVHSVDPANAREWIRADPSVTPDSVLHMTFDTPLGNKPEMQCGRVLFDDFHVEEADLDWAQSFPQECKPGPMTAQEKLLEFMIFDLSSCIGPEMPPK